jgi:uncharacterized coiled-coil protein SlyX
MTDREQIALLDIKVAHLEQHIRQLNTIIAQWETLCKQQLAKQEEWNARLLGVGGGGQAYE